jgi:hypothetical protein
MAPMYQFELSEEQAVGFRKLGYNPVKFNQSVEQIAELDRSNWIVVPKKEGNNFIKDSSAFNASPGRLAYSPVVEKVATELNKTLENNLRINYGNTSKDSLSREFVGDNNWKESMMLNQFLGVKAPNLSEKVDYLHLLYLGSQNEIKVYDVSGKQVDSKLCEKLLMDTIKAQRPWRAEWIDANYKTKMIAGDGEIPDKKILEVHSDHIFNKQGNIINYKSEVLDSDTLIEDKKVDVTDYITKNHTPQGQISKKVKSGDFHYFYPRSDNNSVSGFGVDLGRAGLISCRDPSDRDLVLGVQAVKLAKE